ncbi:UDP-N-acetylglucosamine diphosphorylase/glucosamine-1-phosphate N-acetyltransferase [Halieaceae bacterium IMCC14734]|uniref:Bifunctional protein GlmU n=1 Tax=Candidatus Litorirhabdus singularis TaxID=2518993 RepID=A0ABT3TF03_9GAMM|nr:bifunctional UDP-N-acetylglucosamine diphosphorylase/glucosamine-1-phosphate N-acetyltransferase GlmU [Candidatus Litorirhabdus singularis]MCX2979994.1 UDP-N-acetylglucosamine diphosphorylase/glucosamine-1-phosphate N-acetyltransferase [Candidatus Litorirhabdus singularis]
MSLEVVILAAGQGTRMKSGLPKVLHAVAGRPMLQHVVDSAQALSPLACHVVVGHGGDKVREQLEQPGVQWVEQTEQLGTGHAVLQALPDLADDSIVLVLYGDVPLITSATLQTMVAAASKGPALLTAMMADSGGYGRVVRDDTGAFVAVVEDKDASPEQKLIKEINSGVLAAPAAQLREWLPAVGNNNSQGEYYLPDILSLAVSQGITVATCQATSELEILGVNDRVQLNQVEREYQQRQAQALMLSGVTLADAGRIDVRGTLSCGSDVFIDANAVFIGDVSLGSNVQIGANCVLINTSVDDGSEILPFSHLEQASVGKHCAVGPYARLRPAAVLAEGAKIGNFVEVKKSTIGKGSKVNHLTYIGDCEMGVGVNVGAGTITCNYDGANKYVTTIGDGAFVGSNSTLVAPLTIAENGFVGAGSAITREVGSDQLAVSRAKQRNIDGWKRPSKD